jgi:hypothetical protein
LVILRTRVIGHRLRFDLNTFCGFDLIHVMPEKR